MITENRLKTAVLERAEELVSAFAKEVVRKHVKLTFQGGLIEKYVKVANRFYPECNEDQCVGISGLHLDQNYKEVVSEAIQTLNLNGLITDGFSVHKS